MLRKDIKKLKLILSMLFYSANYFRIKKNGSVIIKKHWYSPRKLVVTLEDIFSNYIPNSIGLDSNNAVVDYQMEMSELLDGPIDKRITLAFNTVSTYVNETDYKGCMLDWDFKPTLTSYVADKLGNLRENIVEAYNQVILEMEFRSGKMSISNGNVIALKSMPSASIISVQDIINKQREKISFDQIGKVITGDPDFDSNIQRIYKFAYISPG